MIGPLISDNTDSHKFIKRKQAGRRTAGDIIKPSQSLYNVLIWIVPKKEDSKGNKRWRMILDFRALNDKIIGDAYPTSSTS